MSVKKYRKKPVEVEAVQWDGKNIKEILRFTGDKGRMVGNHHEVSYLLISTLEGTMVASVGDFIIKGVDGEFYPCKEDIFKKTYEGVYKVRKERKLTTDDYTPITDYEVHWYGKNGLVE